MGNRLREVKQSGVTGLLQDTTRTLPYQESFPRELGGIGGLGKKKARCGRQKYSEKKPIPLHSASGVIRARTGHACNVATFPFHKNSFSIKTVSPVYIARIVINRTFELNGLLCSALKF